LHIKINSFNRTLILNFYRTWHKMWEGKPQPVSSTKRKLCKVNNDVMYIVILLSKAKYSPNTGFLHYISGLLWN